ncbi:MAG: hypothetical protein K2X43_17715 [Hyphomonadaceae bacterium]|jgi:hypothetical protein|nr:hypothetical protein [Hyphomonadaceae bacterium]
MSASERSDPKAGPFVNLSQTYCNNLDILAKGYEPMLKGVGRWNLEVMGLMTRRARAWLEVPMRVGQCKTPQDLVGEQLKFWQTAVFDYSEGARRLTVAFGALTGPGFTGAQDGKTAAPARDHIDFTDAKPAAAAADVPKRERRAA